MSNLNRVFLIGRLTRDPELRYTPQGTPVTEIGLAINREYTVGTERRKETTFVDVTLWKRQAEVVCQYLKKGAPIFIEGRLSLDTWEQQDGQKRSRMRVVAENFQFIGGRSDGAGEGGGGGGFPGEESRGYGARPAYGSRQPQRGAPPGKPGVDPIETGSGNRIAQPPYGPPGGGPPDGSPEESSAPEESPLGLGESEIPF